MRDGLSSRQGTRLCARNSMNSSGKFREFVAATKNSFEDAWRVDKDYAAQFESWTTQAEQFNRRVQATLRALQDKTEGTTLESVLGRALQADAMLHAVKIGTESKDSTGAIKACEGPRSHPGADGGTCK